MARELVNDMDHLRKDRKGSKRRSHRFWGSPLQAEGTEKAKVLSKIRGTLGSVGNSKSAEWQRKNKRSDSPLSFSKKKSTVQLIFTLTAETL